ncbi:outer membrane protein assembly factor BamC [Vibrio nigripulchritudo]|uniref:outer membrane protein assembly factor BamC n=1 Tax=Vibrio nigripulchritudo TaxID=28173 RepID=UPI00249291FD|nr:outer membrane protein assembly factor BamC [Vibrio nigripulchritudo]BDU38117.1 outer membrane protein assembly factor BamC [Vibrio nigripulchritudo]BDU43840.1 outer membrane protein assembly factor BamC [Vibrio nigripulchritudo]
MKFSRQLVTGSLAVFVLAACSSDPSSRRQAKDDFTYLETKPLKEWSLPQGATPQFYPNYDIPAGEYTGGIGKSVDIRPPQQILDLIPGARSEVKEGEATLWLVRESEQEKVWRTALQMISNQGIGLRDNTSNRIETDWVTWRSEDEDTDIGSRYLLERFESNRRYGFKISLIDWREGNQVKPVKATDKERYNILMTNLVTSTYDNNLRAEAALKAQELVKRIPISLGKDRSGLPVIIARAPYATLWQHMPTILPQIGFEIEDRNQSQGIIKVKYAKPDDEFWQKIGMKPLDLSGSSFTFLMGDLDNRTSINVTDSSDKPINEQLLTDLAPILAKVAENSVQ